MGENRLKKDLTAGTSQRLPEHVASPGRSPRLCVGRAPQRLEASRAMSFYRPWSGVVPGSRPMLSSIRLSSSDSPTRRRAEDAR